MTESIGRPCAWCREPMHPLVRSDAKTCSKRCRQAKARFRVSPANATAGTSMRFAYADPPYPGMARRYYGTAEVNHRLLIGTLMEAHPQGWALSTAASTLQGVLTLCPQRVRVAAWVKGPRHCKARFPRSSWEPLIVWGGRARQIGVEEYSCDTLLYGGRQHSHPGALIGMKSAPFAEWMFQQLGAAKGDTLDDIFPGSGIVGRAWDMHQQGDAQGSSSLDAARERQRKKLREAT